MNKTLLFATSALMIVPALALVPVKEAGAAQGKMQHGGSGGHTMKMGMTAMQSLKKLRGKAFDVAFLSQMIAHHQGALTMAKDALPTLRDAGVRRHAQNIITSQAKEIREMSALLQTSYETKPSAAQMNLMKSDMRGMMAMKPNGDRMFLEMMLPHHQGAVEMSRLTLTNSSSPRVKSLANRIIKDQSAEIADFRNLLKQGAGSAAVYHD